jgi:hypothetical protein
MNKFEVCPKLLGSNPMYIGSTATKTDQGPIITQERSLEITIAAEKCRTDPTASPGIILSKL